MDVAVDGIQVAFERPAVDHLAGLEAHLTQLDRTAIGRGVPGLLLELAARDGQERIRGGLAFVGLTLGIDHAPTSLAAQSGPPGWASSTSTESPVRRKRTIPADSFAMVRE